MSYTTNIAELEADWKRRIVEVPRAVQVAQARWGKTVWRLARQYSSGTIRTSDLRKIRPGLYSIVRSASFEVDAVINNQTGNFFDGWRNTSIRFGELYITTVTNEDPKAGYLMGADRPRSRMRYRGALERAILDTVDLFPSLVTAARRAENI